MQLSFDSNRSPQKHIEFRDYQTECIDKVEKAFNEGCNRQLVVLPTSCGKTIIFSGVADKFLKTGKKVLVLAHREELLGQAGEKMAWVVGPDYVMQVEMAEQIADDADVVLASVATIGRAGGKRITRFRPEDFGALIIDEAHHAIATTYQNVIDYFVGRVRKDILLLGVTATDKRGDEEALSPVFDRVVFQRTMLDMARAGWVSPVVSYRISSRTDLSRVKTTAGDYNLRDLASAVNNDERNTLIIETYMKKFFGKQALAFATDLDHVERLVSQFQSVGVRAASITGDTDKDVRRETLARFHRKEIDIVCNFGVLTEGYDYDQLGVIIQARPTQSGLLLTQMVGRANRLHPEKKCAEIIEIVDYHSEKTATVAGIFGFRKDFDCESHNFVECCNKAEELQKEFPNFNPFNTRSWTEMLARYEAMVKRREAMQQAIEAGDGSGERKTKEDLYFEDAAESEFFENRYRFTYVGVDRLVMQFRDEMAGERLRAVVQKTAMGDWAAGIYSKPLNAPRDSGSTPRFGIKQQHQIDAVKELEVWILANFPHLDILLNVSAKWRERAKEQPVTDKQWAIIEKNRLAKVPRDKVSKADAMQLISAFFDKRSGR